MVTRIRSIRAELFLTIVLALAPSLPAVGQSPAGFEAAVALEEALVTSIARSEDSVVAIARVRRGAEAPRDPIEFSPDDGILPEAFRRPDPTSIDFIPAEYGTGVVVDRRGLILTNYHVLGDVDSCDYFVTTSDRVVYSARVRAADPWSDLAVLQIEAENLTPISWGDGDSLQKGRIVISLGNPYALARDGEVSAGWGIVSNIARKAALSEDADRGGGRPTMHHYGTLIQVDARVNLGTSGGALLDLHGNMVGLTTALAALPGHDGAGSVGYAIPVDAAFRRIVEELKAGRAVEFGFLGIAPEELTMRERVNGLRGVRVRQIVPGTPAARSDLKEDAIITHVQGVPIHEPDELILRVGQEMVDSTIQLTILEEGRSERIPVTLSKRFVENRRVVVTSQPPLFWRGVHVDYATAIPRFSQLSGNVDPEGCVAIVEVQPDSPAWRAGLRPGLFVSHVGQQRVERPTEFNAAVANLKGDADLRLTTRIAGNPIVSVEP